KSVSKLLNVRNRPGELDRSPGNEAAGDRIDVLIGDQKCCQLPKECVIRLVVPELLQGISERGTKDKAESSVAKKQLLQMRWLEWIEIEPARNVIKENVVTERDLAAASARHQNSHLLQTVEYFAMCIFEWSCVSFDTTFVHHCFDDGREASFSFSAQRNNAMIPIFFEQVRLVPD